MLLIDDDEAEIGERQEQRRTRADDDPRFAARRGGPDALALALGQAGVPFGRPGAEAGREPVEELCRERDLREQHEPLATPPQHFGDRLEINLRLARSRHPFKQRSRKGAIGDSPGEILGRRALVGVEADRAKIRFERRRDCFRRQGDGKKGAVGDKAVDHACRTTCERRERRLGRRCIAVGDRRHDPGPRVGHPRRGLPGSDEAEFRPWRLGDLAGPDRHPEQHAAGAKRPAGDPIDEIAQRRPERRPVEGRGDRLQVVAAGRTDGPNDAGRKPGAERHADTGSRFELPFRRRAIAIGGVDGDRRQYVYSNLRRRIA